MYTSLLVLGLELPLAARLERGHALATDVARADANLASNAVGRRKDALLGDFVD
jgi:hypothetical protein